MNFSRTHQSQFFMWSTIGYFIKFGIFQPLNITTFIIVKHQQHTFHWVTSILWLKVLWHCQFWFSIQLIEFLKFRIMSETPVTLSFETEHALFTWPSIIKCIILGIIIIAAIVANTFMCMAFCMVRKIRKPNNYLIVSLAVTDLSVSILVSYNKWLFVDSEKKSSNWFFIVMPLFADDSSIDIRDLW